jgi:hypothetical protein
MDPTPKVTQGLLEEKQLNNNPYTNTRGEVLQNYPEEALYVFIFGSS